MCQAPSPAESANMTTSSMVNLEYVSDCFSIAFFICAFKSEYLIGEHLKLTLNRKHCLKVTLTLYNA